MNVLIVEARYHPYIADALMDGATMELERGAAAFDRVAVSGAWEIPAAISMAARGPRPWDGYIALGTIVRGPGFNFEIVAGSTAHGLMRLAVDHGLAIGNGIIAADDEEQAYGLAVEVGGEAARACLALMTLRGRLGIYS